MIWRLAVIYRDLVVVYYRLTSMGVRRSLFGRISRTTDRRGTSMISIAFCAEWTSEGRRRLDQRPSQPQPPTKGWRRWRTSWRRPASSRSSARESVSSDQERRNCRRSRWWPGPVYSAETTERPRQCTAHITWKTPKVTSPVPSSTSTPVPYVELMESRLIPSSTVPTTQASHCRPTPPPPPPPSLDQRPFGHFHPNTFSLSSKTTPPKTLWSIFLYFFVNCIFIFVNDLEPSAGV